MTKPLLIAAVGLALLAPSVADAQKPKKDRREKMRQKIRQKVRAMREWKLTEALELDTKTADKLFPILDSYDAKFVKVMHNGRKLRRKLRKQLEGGKASEKQIDAIIDDMLDNQRAIWTLNEERFKAARKVLSAEQAAKALIVLPQIDHAIRREMHEALEGRRHRGKRRRFEDPF